MYLLVEAAELPGGLVPEVFSKGDISCTLCGTIAGESGIKKAKQGECFKKEEV